MKLHRVEEQTPVEWLELEGEPESVLMAFSLEGDTVHLAWATKIETEAGMPPAEIEFVLRSLAEALVDAIGSLEYRPNDG